MKKRYILIILAVVMAAAAALYRAGIFNLAKTLPEIKKAADLIVDKVKKDIIAPPPLRGPSESAKSVLTKSGVIVQTNVQRRANGLADLKENADLDAAAAIKANDMFARQYFAHVSPTGEDVGTLAEAQGYKYIIIGENLALGNYADDKALVQAWMDSPGHRANILNTSYREIGVAVKKGVFEGRSTWLAVQTFGLSENVCPSPDSALKATIDANQDQLKIWADELQVKREELDSTRPKRGTEYNDKVKEYNALVESYNKLLEETRVYINQYNEQINETNNCRASFS